VILVAIQVGCLLTATWRVTPNIWHFFSSYQKRKLLFWRPCCCSVCCFMSGCNYYGNFGKNKKTLWLYKKGGGSGLRRLHCRSPRVVCPVDVICSHNLANFIASHLHGLIKDTEQ